jgi:flagellar hook assembly protein FlgD
MLMMAVYCYAEIESAVSSIEIEPNPMEKNAVIRVTFSQKVGAEIIIETQEGTLVKTFFSGDFNLGTYEYFWDRLDDNGEFVPQGEYYVTVNYDYRYTSTKKTIILK